MKSSKNGVVAIIDALGIKNQTLTESKKFLKHKEQLLSKAENRLEQIENIPNFTEDLVASSNIFTFGDTIIFSFELTTSDPNERKNILGLFSEFLANYFRASLNNGIFYRGAFSIGDYIVNSSTNTLLGPAISDAAAWHERANWFGIHATPKTCLKIMKIKERGSFSEFIRYPVPFKKSSSDGKSLALNWPNLDYVNTILSDYETPKEKLLDEISVKEIPQGTEEKYFNTIDFFEEVYDQKNSKISYEETEDD